MSKQVVIPEPVDDTPQMPKTWQPEVDLKSLKVETPLMEQPSSDTFLKSLLQRKHEPLSDCFKLNVEMHGIFSLPDQWKAKIVSLNLAVTLKIGRPK
jgi:hypothetical protein